jgi:ADP-ribosylglycohydrolase
MDLWRMPFMAVQTGSVAQQAMTSPRSGEYPPDYVERVYAGVLGKLIGVYLGRPIESWWYERITKEIGEVEYYLPGRNGAPLVVTDDDVTGTFTFLRALPDHGNSRDLSPRQIGETWLNYVIERRTIFWWGGFGNSTEHTAYLRLKHGVPAPESGSIALNTKVVAEQIGSQIFIDGWAMVAPGDPELAADFARRAASVSHDGEAIYGAQMLAAMEAQAFVESDTNKLLDTGLSFIPRDSVIARLVHDVREWHAQESDWRKTREFIGRDYGYDTYPGNCHMVPNHALIIHGLLHGEDDFSRSLMIVNTCGWDTDCNSGNLGCLLGIKNGLRTFEGGKDWRGPVADRLYLPTADGGRAITDAVTETYHIVNTSRDLNELEPVAPKNGARFHFSLPGSVQGFSVESTGTARATIENRILPDDQSARGLAIRVDSAHSWDAVRVMTPTYTPPEAINMPGYELLASPTMHPGQTVKARLLAISANSTSIDVKLLIKRYGAYDQLEDEIGPSISLAPGASHVLEWTVGGSGGYPIQSVGVEVASAGDDTSTLFLDWLTWNGEPNTTFGRPEDAGIQWHRSWVNGVDQFDSWWPEPFRIVKNEGYGLISRGGRDWKNYRVEAPFYIHLAKSGGIAARVQGLRRYYGLQLTDAGTVRLTKAFEDAQTTLGEMAFAWEPRVTYRLWIEVDGARIRAGIDEEQLFDVDDVVSPLMDGGIGLIVEEGCVSAREISISPVR